MFQFAKRFIHRGINSQGILLVPKSSIDRIKEFKFSLAYRIVSIYNKGINRPVIDFSIENPQNFLKKAFLKRMEEKRMEILKPDNYKDDLVYIISSFIDKEKKMKLFQLYYLVLIDDKKFVVILEKTVFNKIDCNMWRILGII